MSIADQMRGAMRDDAGLAGPGAGQDQERALAVQHRLPLFRIEVLKEPHRPYSTVTLLARLRG